MLKTQDPHSRNRPHLIDRLREDIRHKGLRPGDRYLTANEAAQAFNASVTTIHRAMNELAEEDMLVRHRSRGTFVGPKMEDHGPVKLHTVHLLIPSETYVDSDFPFSSMIRGLRQAMGEVSVQHSFVPPRDGLAYVREMLRSMKSAGKIDSFVPMSCPRNVYTLLAESGVPTVVLGTLYPDQKEIPSIDVDSREYGRLLIHHLVQRGHRQILLLTAATGKPGDNLFFDGVSEALTAARLPPDALTVRMVPHDEVESLPSIIHEALERPEHPAAVIARGPAWLGKATEATFASITDSLPDRVEVVYVLNPITTGWGVDHTIVKAEKNAMEIFESIGRMLDQIIQGLALEQRRVVIPMRLRADVKDPESEAEPTDKQIQPTQGNG